MTLDLNAQVGRSIGQFGFQFLNAIDPNATITSNAVISPISLATALWLVHLGTERGSASANEFSRVFSHKNFSLNSKVDSDAPYRGLGSICKNLSKANEEELASKESKRHNEDTHHYGRDDPRFRFIFKSANLLLTNEKLTGDLNVNFERALNTYYNASVAKFKISSQEVLDFSKDVLLHSESKSKTIQFNVSDKEHISSAVNHWISNKTNNKINDLLNVDSLPELDNLACMIVNAVHLKACWQDAFDKDSTRDGYFSSEGNQNKKTLVPFMHSYDQYFSYFDSLETGGSDEALSRVMSIGFKVLELPLITDGKYQATSMVIVLPNNMTDLQRLQSSLTWTVMEEIYERMRFIKVEAIIPKFKIDFRVEAKRLLMDMGLTEMFNDKSKITEMFESAKLPVKVSDIMHGATIEVNEAGVEAAAATIVTMVEMSAFQEEPPIFCADHPFIFFIRHVMSNTPLFIGRLVKF